jgi:hypothetical protein
MSLRPSIRSFLDGCCACRQLDQNVFSEEAEVEVQAQKYITLLKIS